MTVRDIFCSFTDDPKGVDQSRTFSIAGPNGIYPAPNAVDSGRVGSFLTELSETDQFLMDRYPQLIARDIGNSVILVVQWLQGCQLFPPGVDSNGCLATIRFAGRCRRVRARQAARIASTEILLLSFVASREM